MRTDKITNPEGYSFTLFTYPWCPNLTKEQMIATRASLQNKINGIWESIKILQDAMATEIFNQGIENKLIYFRDKVKPITEAFQKAVNNEIYFQHTFNSQEKLLYLDFKVAVTSIEHITHFYESNRIMIPYLAEALRKELSLKTDINKSYVIAYPDNQVFIDMLTGNITE